MDVGAEILIDSRWKFNAVVKFVVTSKNMLSNGCVSGSSKWHRV